MRPMAIAACLVLGFAALTACAQETTGSTTAAPAAAAAVVTPTDTSAVTSVQGDIERGRLLTYTCRGCHGVEGYRNAYPSYEVPMIGGQSASYLVNSLSDYRSGARKHPTMQAQAQSFSEQDIADIAAFLSNVK
ncbi:MAG: cytochrome c [Pseudomonadota bacterium]|nr:cytochrome c [Pseudomonadota bacterium]